MRFLRQAAGSPARLQLLVAGLSVSLALGLRAVTAPDGAMLRQAGQLQR